MLQMIRNQTIISTASATCFASSRTWPSTVISSKNSRLTDKQNAAPTPIGPKKPTKDAWNLFSIWWMYLCIAKTIGTRRTRRIKIPRKIRRQIGMISLCANDAHGQTAPNHMKMAKFSNISIVGCSESSNVARRNQSLYMSVRAPYLAICFRNTAYS